MVFFEQDVCEVKKKQINYFNSTAIYDSQQVMPNPISFQIMIGIIVMVFPETRVESVRIIVYS